MKTRKIYVDQLNRHLVETYDDNGYVINKKWEDNDKEDYFHGKAEFTGWLNVSDEDTGLFNTEKDAERGIIPDKRITEVLNPFDGKKVKITVETIE